MNENNAWNVSNLSEGIDHIIIYEICRTPLFCYKKKVMSDEQNIF